jgi:hypothetical protein
MDELNDVVYNYTPQKSLTKVESKASPFDLIKGKAEAIDEIEEQNEFEDFNEPSEPDEE